MSEPAKETRTQVADTHAEQPRGAAATKAPRKKRDAPGKADKLPPYHVVLHNDDVNGMEHVVRTITMLTPLTQDVAVRRMIEAHTRQRARLLTTHKERAELYRDQFKSRQLTVTIEPAA